MAVEARPAGLIAQEVDTVLANALQRVGVQAHEETLQLRIGGEAAQHVVGDRGERVISAQAFIERWRVALGGNADCKDRQQKNSSDCTKWFSHGFLA